MAVTIYYIIGLIKNKFIIATGIVPNLFYLIKIAGSSFLYCLEIFANDIFTESVLSLGSINGSSLIVI
jgi:succinyl-CoA synthetase alpha subunit